MTVGGEIARKAGVSVPRSKTVALLPGPRYVSRGGEKLEGALDDFHLSPAGQVCLDIGASTGGFTDCLLQRGATRVFAIDVGRAQLDDSLRQDPRVLSLEQTHIGELDPARLPEKAAFVVIDVSFISLRKVLPHVARLAAPGATVLPMVKPQFEVGPKFLKKGVVKDDAARDRAVDGIAEFAKEHGFVYFAKAPARLKGPKGNQEFFLHLALAATDPL